MYATSILAAQAAPRNISGHPEDFCLLHAESENVSAPSWSTHRRTRWFLSAKGIIVTRGNTIPQDVVLLYWLRNTICSGPPSSHPSDLVRVGHQILHESHRLRFHRGVYWCTTRGQVAQRAAGKKSRAIGLVNERPGYLTRAGRDVLARIETETERAVDVGGPSDSRVWSSVRQEDGTEHPVASILRFHSCHAKVYDRMPPVQHLRELPLQWRRPHTNPGPHCVRGQQRS